MYAKASITHLLLYGPYNIDNKKCALSLLAHVLSLHNLTLQLMKSASEDFADNCIIKTFSTKKTDILQHT